MESFRHDIAPETRRPTMFASLRTACRITILGMLPCLGGDLQQRPSRIDECPAYAAVAQDAEAPFIPYEGIAAGNSLIGTRILYGDTLHLEIHQRDGELELSVNGKRYGMQETMGVAVGKTINTVTAEENGICIRAAEYGDASVNQTVMNDVLTELSVSNTPTVTINVSTHFTPCEGTPLATAMCMRRMWKGWKKGDPESFDVTFIRKHAPRESDVVTQVRSARSPTSAR